MKKLPKDLKLLMRIGERLDSLMKDQYTSVEIRSNELYEYAIKDKHLFSKFHNQIEFNRFLRKQHDKGFLKQIIPNCRVDDTNKSFYQWHFRKKGLPKKAAYINKTPVSNQLNIQNYVVTSLVTKQEKIKNG